MGARSARNSEFQRRSPPRDLDRRDRFDRGGDRDRPFRDRGDRVDRVDRMDRMDRVDRMDRMDR
jgi:hypothetical protein